MPIPRSETAAHFFLLLDRIDSYEPGIYKKIKKEVFTKELVYSSIYKDYKLGNWIEKSKYDYWCSMSYFQKLMYYLNIRVPSKLLYWDNYPRFFIF
jgi:hypothetical protein